MKNHKILIALSFLSFSIASTAQLFVRPNGANPSYVFVDDTFVYVEQDVELEVNPNALEEASIILRSEAQLLQGDGADQDNKGTGDISVFQEGTVNQFDYNYWASPVGLSFNGFGGAAPDGNSIFSMRPVGGGFADTNQVLFYPTSLVDSNPALLDPSFDSSVATGGPLNLATFWLWTFESGEDYADWIHIDDLNTIPAGQGFTMKGVGGTDTTDAEGNGIMNNAGSAQRYDFRGRPNNGDISVSVGTDQLSLVGNPYPSALDLNYFLLQNSGTGTFPAPGVSDDGTSNIITKSDITTGIAYFWDSNPNVMSHFLVDYEGGYGTYSPMMSIAPTAGMYVNATFYLYDETGAQIPGSDGTITQLNQAFDRRYSPIGQGFMVEGDAGGMVQFTNNQRRYILEGDNSDFKSSKSTIKENVSKISEASLIPEEITMIKIGIGINDTYSRELGIGLANNATRGYDIAGDAQNGLLASDVSFSIEEEKGYVINAAPRDEYQHLPITLDAETPSEFKFLAHYTENFTYNGVYLYDSLTNTHHDILNESVTIRLDAGEHKRRFSIKFTRDQNNGLIHTSTTQEETAQEQEETDVAVNVESPVIENSILETFSIFQNNSSRQLEIHNPSSASLETMSLFDISGKLVISENQLGSQSIYSFSTDSLSSGVYIVQFNTTEGFTKAQKVRIAN